MSIEHATMSDNRSIHIEIKFDEDAKIFYVATSSLPGLNAEGATTSEILGHIQAMILDLIAVQDSMSATIRTHPKTLHLDVDLPFPRSTAAC